MLTSIKEAVTAAAKWWVENRGDFAYPTTTVSVRADNKELSGRRVDIRLVSDTTYTVVRLFVANDGEISVWNDRREKILDMMTRKPELAILPDKEASHLRSVEAVTSALGMVQNDQPLWFSAVEMAAECAQNNIADVIVKLAGRQNRTATVRIKVVQSLAAKAASNHYISDQERVRFIVLVCKDGVLQPGLRKELVNRFRQIRLEAKLG